MGILVTWSELTGTRPTKGLLRERLAPYALQPVLLGLARLSAQLVTWQQKQNARGELEAVRQLLPRYYPAVAQLVAANADRMVLTRITLLYVAKQALGTCTLEGKDVQTQWDTEQIMGCCFMGTTSYSGESLFPQIEPSIKRPAFYRSAITFRTLTIRWTFPAISFSSMK